MAKSKLESRVEERLSDTEQEHRVLVKTRVELDIRIIAKVQEIAELRKLLRKEE